MLRPTSEPETLRMQVYGITFTPICSMEDKIVIQFYKE